MNENKLRIIHFLLKLSLAFAFLYPAVAIHISPNSWIGYFPNFMHEYGLVNIITLIMFSVVHAIIGLWILSGIKIFIPTLIAAIFLASVILLNFSHMNVLFRDVSILITALTLAIWNYPFHRTVDINTK